MGIGVGSVLVPWRPFFWNAAEVVELLHLLIKARRGAPAREAVSERAAAASAGPREAAGPGREAPQLRHEGPPLLLLLLLPAKPKRLCFVLSPKPKRLCFVPTRPPPCALHARCSRGTA